jgi:hypothetical protein
MVVQCSCLRSVPFRPPQRRAGSGRSGQPGISPASACGVRTGRRAEQAARSAREVPYARAWGFQQNISWERRPDPPLVYASPLRATARARRPLSLFESWKGATASARHVRGRTCWVFTAVTIVWTPPHQNRSDRIFRSPEAHRMSGRDAASF